MCLHMSFRHRRGRLWAVQQPAAAAAVAMGCIGGRAVQRAEVLPRFLHFECNEPAGPGHNSVLPAHTRACSLFPHSCVSEGWSFSSSLHWNSWLASAGFRGNLSSHPHKIPKCQRNKRMQTARVFSCLRSKHAVPIHSSGSERSLAKVHFTFYTHWLWVWGCVCYC